MKLSGFLLFFRSPRIFKNNLPTHESLSFLSFGREGGDIKHSGVKLELVRASGRNVPRNRAIYFAEKICSVMVRCSIFSLLCITITWSE